MTNKDEAETLYETWLTHFGGESSEAYFHALGCLEKAAAMGHKEAQDEFNRYLADCGGDEKEGAG